MASYEVCIDMGSSYTTIYKRNVGVVLREATLALMDTSGKNMKVLKMGIDAERMYGKSSDGEVFVRPVVEGIVKNIELSQRLISHFLSKVVKYHIIKPSIKVIVLLPIGLSDEQYEDYRKVFYAVGFSKIDFVFAMSSASLIDFHLISNSKTKMLVNIGAGKTEMAVIIDGKIVSACSINVGGNLVDRSIVEYLQRNHGYILSMNTACKLKQEIGSLYESDSSSMEVVVQDSSANGQVAMAISAQDIFNPICENYFRIVQTMQAFFNSCSQEVAQDIVHEGIVLMGGGALISGVEQFFKKILKVSVLVSDDAEIVPLLGSEKLFANYNLLQKVVEEN